MGTILVLGGLFIGLIGTPFFCLGVGVWRSLALSHVRFGWGIAVGFGVGLGAVLLNIVVGVYVYFALVEAAPVVSGEWGMLWVAVVCPYLTAAGAVVGTWRLCNRKDRREQSLREEATTAEVTSHRA